MEAVQQQLSEGVVEYRLRRSNGFMSRSAVLEGWRSDPEFRRAYNQLLADAPYPAFFWEHPRWGLDELDIDYCFVLVDSPQLARIRSNYRPFTEQFSAEGEILHFSSLRGDAELVVPNARTLEGDYPSIAAFVRTAPAQAIQRLWQLTGDTVVDTLARRDAFLNTSGLGVYWLHIRVDSRPKYYTHGPYR